MSRFYFGGELLSLKHLLGDVALAQAIKRASNGKYEAVLPQDLEVTDKRGKAIRDVDILTLLSCELALFQFDGPELDSGTVAEFMLAKFADVPTALLRTDFRKAGDSPQDPWNLTPSDYPRTEKSFSTAWTFTAQLEAPSREATMRPPRRRQPCSCWMG